MKTKLYLPGSLCCSDTDGAYLLCPVPTSVIVYVVHYCQVYHFELVFISESDGVHMLCSLPKRIFSEMNVSFVSWAEVPDVVRNVLLPSLHQPELSLVRSGLCVLLRHIIKESHAAIPRRHLIDLLGFRQGSMKMCAEVSGWTKLCEVDLPHSTSQLIVKLKEHERQTCKGDGKSCMLTLPGDLIKLECHFQKKCRVHNDDKKRRSELIQLKKCLTKMKETNIPLAGGRHTGPAHLDLGTESPPAISSLSTPTDCEESNVESASDHIAPVASPRVCLEKLSYKDGRLQIEQVVTLYHGIRRVKVDRIFEEYALRNLHVEKETDRTTMSCVESPMTTDSSSPTTGPVGIMELVEKLTYLDLDYVHTYSEGQEMTIADLVLFVYVYHLLEALSFNTAGLAAHIPRILEWAGHMTSLATVVAAGQRSGWDIKSLARCLTGCLDQAEVMNSDLGCQDKGWTFVREVEVMADEDEMELSRCARMKHKALKPEVCEALKKIETAHITPVIGCHPRGDLVQLEWASLPPGVHPKEGDVPEKRTQRKCQQLENLVTAVQAVAKPGDILVDFCSGGGHLGIVMAYLLPECQVCLVENKEESLLKACARLKSLQLNNVTLYQCNLDYFMGKFDVGVCLHACGSATDMVLQLCLNSLASFVICPCCYGSIQKTHLLSYPRSKQFLQTNVTYKDFLTLGHAADQTEFNMALESQGHLCMNLVDTDRAEYAREFGYIVTLCSLTPHSCSPKNNLLIGTRTRM